MWTLFSVLAFTGMRLEGALALEWHDVMESERLIHVRRSIGPNGRLKTIASDRKVPLAPALVNLLQRHRTVFAAFGSKRGDRVFPSVLFNLRRMQDLWTRAIVVSGIEHARVHDLRHTYAVHALDSGTALNTLQSILGHSDATMALRYARRQSDSLTVTSGERVAASLMAAMPDSEDEDA